MTRKTKAQQEAEAILRAAFDAGCDYFKEHADDMMTEVHRYASGAYPDAKELALEFALGYATARSRYDEYLREKK